MKKDSILLTPAQGRKLVKLARDTIRKRLFGGVGKEDDKGEIEPEFLKKQGVFVTLHKRGELRGCIGHIIGHLPLWEGVRENALNAAFSDPRFMPLSPEEFEDIDIEVSVLTEPVPLIYGSVEELLDKLRPGRDGVIIKKGGHQATFLPQVWQQLPDKESFLSHLCIKASLPPNEWKKGDLEVYTYEVQSFSEDDPL